MLYEGRSYRQHLAIALAVGLSPLLLILLTQLLLPGFMWESFRLDSCIDATAACTAFFLAAHLYYTRFWQENMPAHFRWIVVFLINFSIISLIDSWTEDPATTFWMDSSAALLAALPLLGVFLPSIKRTTARRISVFLICLTPLIGFAELQLGDWLAPALTNGKFTWAVMLPRLLAGAIFYLASIRFFFGFYRRGKREESVFFLLTLFIGSLNAFYPLLTPWHASWWLLAFARPLPYALALFFLLPEYRIAVVSLFKQEEQFRTLFEESPAGHVIYGRHYNIKKVNRAFAKMLGYSETELLGTNALALCHSEDLPRTLQAGEELFVGILEDSKLERRYKKKDGTFIWTNSIARLVSSQDESEPEALVVTEDISDRKQADKLKLEKELADSASRAKSQFIAHMNHEIRTPLGAISGFIELLKSWPTSEKERESTFHRININLKMINEMIEDMLDLARIESGKIELVREDVDLPSLVGEVCSALEMEVRRKGLVVRSEFQEIPQTVSVDRKRVRQVLTNLLGNAIKFTSHGKIAITSRLETTSGGDRIVVCVEDTGIGLTKEEATRIFEPFTQAGPTTSAQYGGTGLGLTISRRLAKALGGDLVLKRSAPGKGSLFEFTFDLSPVFASSMAASVGESLAYS